MTRGRGSSKTPEKVVFLLKKAVAEKSQSAVSKETGLGLATINSYLKGIGEPTTNTLQTLADYFRVSVWELRGEIPKFELEDKATYIDNNSQDDAKSIDISLIDRKVKDALAEVFSKEFLLASLSQNQHKQLTEKRYSITINIEHGKIVGASAKPVVDDLKTKELTDTHVRDVALMGLGPAHAADKNEAAKQNRKKKTDEATGSRESKSKVKKK